MAVGPLADAAAHAHRHGLAVELQAFGIDDLVDFEEGTLDLDVMVAVNKTADTVVRRTPLIGTIFGGSLVSVPVKVRGRIAEPQVIYLSPSAAVSNLTEMMKRTAGLPLEVLSPIFPKRKE